MDTDGAPVTWLGRKYRAPKAMCGYRSHHDDGQRRGLRRRKASAAERAAIAATQPLVTLVLGPNGKRTFVRQAPTNN